MRWSATDSKMEPPSNAETNRPWGNDVSRRSVVIAPLNNSARTTVGSIHTKEAGRAVAKTKLETASATITSRGTRRDAWKSSNTLSDVTQKRIAEAISRPCGLTAPATASDIGVTAAKTPTLHSADRRRRAIENAQAVMLAKRSVLMSRIR